MSRLGDSLDLPFEEGPPGQSIDLSDAHLSPGLVVMAAVVPVPGIGPNPALVFRFATPLGDFYPPMLLVLDDDQAAKMPGMVRARRRVRGPGRTRGGRVRPDPLPGAPEARCDMSDLPVSMCGLQCHRASDTSGIDAHSGRVIEPEPAADLPVSVVVAARYPGRCAKCSRPYIEGTLIGHCQEVDGWIAGCCSPEVA